MARLVIFLAIVVSLASLSHQEPNALPKVSSSSLTAYNILRRYGFPVGLLPDNVAAYSLDTVTGNFAVELDGICRAVLPKGKIIASFERQVTGKLDDRRISMLEGIRVRAFLRWWTITGIRSSGDDLVFEVGLVSKKFAARYFNATLSCGGGAVKST